jgi:hypothetical protein
MRVTRKYKLLHLSLTSQSPSPLRLSFSSLKSHQNKYPLSRSKAVRLRIKITFKNQLYLSASLIIVSSTCKLISRIFFKRFSFLIIWKMIKSLRLQFCMKMISYSLKMLDVKLRIKINKISLSHKTMLSNFKIYKKIISFWELFL